MKFARRSVSDQDIRRYEMFSQVCRGFIHAVLSMPRLEAATIKRIWKQLQIP